MMPTIYSGMAADAEWAVNRCRLTELAGSFKLVRYLETEAGTGSRYAVVASWLPPQAQATEGGPVLVSVLAPWIDSHVMSDDTDQPLSVGYVYEHLCARQDTLNGGDLAALVMTVAWALNREPIHLDLIGESEVMA